MNALRDLHRLLAAAVLLALAASAAPAQTGQPSKSDPARFAKEIAAFEAADRETPPMPGGVLFTGSSSIRLWDLKKWFPDVPSAVNRGFGGSQTSDVNFYFDRVVLPHKPAVIVFYCGGNDLNAGKTPETVIADFKTFMKHVAEKLPATKVVYMTNNPSPKRWEQRGAQQQVNAAVKSMAEASGGSLIYVNTYDALLGPSGEPRVELFRADKLHLSEPGYEVVTALVKPAVHKALPRK